MKTFHGDKKIKEEFTKILDFIKKPSGAPVLDDFETKLGVPKWFAALLVNIALNSGKIEDDAWQKNLVSRIPVGADLDNIKESFQSYICEYETNYDKKGHDENKYTFLKHLVSRRIDHHISDPVAFWLPDSSNFLAHLGPAYQKQKQDFYEEIIEKIFELINKKDNEEKTKNEN